MLGLEKVYYDLDDCRKRVSKLCSMERLSSDKKERIISLLMTTMEVVNETIEEEPGSA